MSWSLLLLASLAFVSLGDGAPLNIMSAPNLLRVGTTENIFVECQGCSGEDIPVRISIWNHPQDTLQLMSTSLVLNSGNNFQGFGKITIPPASFIADPKVKQYVYLKAQFNDKLLSTVVLVTFQSGYIFIQTDKPLYTPGSTVRYRMFGLTPQMKPIERAGDGGVWNSIDIEIQTPEGIVFSQSSKTLNSGIHAGSYILPHLVTRGVWKVVAKFTSNPQQSFYSNFEVKEYVLPSLEVKLEPETPFYQVDSPVFKVNIKAKYLFGEQVEGMAFVVFGAIIQQKKKTFPGSLERVAISKGVGEVTLKREHITAIFKDVDLLIGNFMFVSVSVLTQSGSEIVEAELKDIKIVKSPYSIQFTRTPKYFKPGMSFDVMVKVTNPDGTPAAGIPVILNPGEVQGTSEDSGTARLTVRTRGTDDRLDITAKTVARFLTPEEQASAQFTANSHITKSSSYIQIGVESYTDMGKSMKVSLTLKNPPSEDRDVTYLIISKGQLVHSGREKIQGQNIITVNIYISEEMLPSFRIVAYYNLDDTEVVSDSVWVDVKDSCTGSLTLEIVDPHASYQPGKSFDLKITGDPGAKVGLVAVDKGVYVLNNKFRLTQEKIWEEVEKYDTGCTPGGGKDSMGVFYDAGLVFQSSLVAGTPYRRELKCPETEKPRSKRAVAITDITTSLVSKYEHDDLQKDCCLDGMRETPLSYNCNRRSKYILDGQACIDAFLDCCEQMHAMLDAQKQNSLKLARSEAKDTNMDSRNIDVRSNFEESWLWTDLLLPACPPKTRCPTKSITIPVYMQDSITTWVLTGISMSSENGICVSKSLEIIAHKEFFIDLKLPYSAVRYEQLEIRAIIHNYARDPVKVRVELVENLKVCSLASKRGKHHEEVSIGGRTSSSVPFVIIPMETGELDIVVKAAVIGGTSSSDGIKKVLRVVSEGVLVSKPANIFLDPVKKGIDGVQTVLYRSDIPKEDVVPLSPHSVLISVTGREDVTEMVGNAISGKSLGSLILQPSDCGEQNMIHMTLPLIAVKYLDATNQWEDVGIQRRDEALQHITTGCTSQLHYRNKDGSYSAWAGRAESSWLTAYVVKVFSMAYHLIKIQPLNICDSVRFLILKSQLPNGMFREIGNVVHNEMVGDIHGLEADASMTAFSLIAMQESKTICLPFISSLSDHIDKSVQYLEKRLDRLTNPYAVALTSYALANSNRLNKEILLKFISPELTHWPVPRGSIYTLEATAYALLALVRAQAFENAQPIVRWLSTQRAALGGFGSTQATIMVYQAVAEYWSKAKEPDYNLNVAILSEGKSQPITYNFDRKNHFNTRTSTVNTIFNSITVTATGTGEANVKMVSLYYAKPSKGKSDCERFNMSVELFPVKENDHRTYMLRIKVLYKHPTHDSTMAILDIGLLTGYTVDTDDLKTLSTGHDRTISNFVMNTLLSDRGSLIIYLDKVSHTLPDEISFKIHRKINAELLQPATVTVYEYYNETRCVKFYHPKRDNGTLLLLKSGDVKTCAEENCSRQKKGSITKAVRNDKFCETSLIDFAYKVRLEVIDQEDMTDINIMRITHVIKGGNIDRSPLGQQRPFISYIRCRNALNLQKRKTYLIMGSNKDVHRNKDTQLYQYVLDEETWIEYWPTDAECETPNYGPTCLDLAEMISVTKPPCDL